MQKKKEISRIKLLKGFSKLVKRKPKQVIFVSILKIKSGMKSLYNALHPYVCPVADKVVRSKFFRDGPLPII